MVEVRFPGYAYVCVQICKDFQSCCTVNFLNNKNTDIKEIKNICFNSEDGGNIFHKVMPIRLVQASAMQVCKTLKAQLSYPLTTEEYQNWPSKLIL